MSSTEDQVRKENLERLRELEAIEQDKRTQAERTEYERLLKEMVKNPQKIEEEKPKEEYQAAPVAKKKISDDLIQDYKAKTKRDPAQSDKGLVFEFESKEEAVDFFKGQAKKNRAFDVYNKELDHRMYSDGKGAFVQGTKAQVAAYIENPKNFTVDLTDGKLTKKDSNEASENPQYKV